MHLFWLSPGPGAQLLSFSDLENSTYNVPVILSPPENDRGLGSREGLGTSGQNIPRDYRLDLAQGHM